METKPKRFKVDASNFIGLKRISFNAVREVLWKLPKDLLDELDVPWYGFRKRLQKAARNVLDDDLKRKIELPLENGTTHTWVIASPEAIVRRMIEISPALRRIFRRIKVGSSEDNPLSIAHYHDEISSGHLLAPVHNRSFTAFRFSFKQFGSHLLSHEEMWFTFGVLRSPVLEKVSGGISYVEKIVMQLFMMGTECFKVTGAVIDVGEGPELIWGNVENIFGDLKAEDATMDTKGSSAIRPCLCCANCTNKDILDDETFPLDNPGGRLFDIKCTDLDKFVPNTNEAIWEDVDELGVLARAYTAKRITKENFELAEKACGRRFNPRGLLACEKLRKHCKPMDVFTHDWPHIYLGNGIGAKELFLFMERMRPHGVRYKTFREELPLWKWTKHFGSVGKSLKYVFSDKRETANRKGQTWRSSSSEFLMLAPVILDYAIRMLSDKIPEEIESFKRLCAVLDYIQALKHGHVKDVGKMNVLVKKHLDKSAEAYGSEHWTIKWHVPLHLAKQFERDILTKADGEKEVIVFDTMCNERDHKTPKGFGDLIQNLDEFEEYVLSRTIASQMEKLKKSKNVHTLLELWYGTKSLVSIQA